MSHELQQVGEISTTQSQRFQTEIPDVAISQRTDVPVQQSGHLLATDTTSREQMDTTRESKQNYAPNVTVQPYSRALGVHNILNPTQSDFKESIDEISSFNREKARSGGGASPEQFAPSLPPLGSRKRTQRAVPPEASLSSARSSGPRRTLTPFSPGRRAENLGARRSGSGVGSGARQVLLPSGEGRAYIAEPGTQPDSDVPPLPTSNPFKRDILHPPQPAEVPPAPPRHTSGTHAGPSSLSRIGLIRKDSPSGSQTSYSYANQNSPPYAYSASPVSHSSHHVPYAASAMNHGPSLTPSAFGDSQYAPSQGTYQMTLDTEQGPMIVPVDLDLHQASRSADEKRKRNAGASARFRARRKEKEKEATGRIDALEKEIRDIAEERDFYISERNFFRDVAMRHLGPSQIPRRPASPPVRRPLLPHIGTDVSSPQSQEHYEDTPEPPARPAVRRRTGEFQTSSRPNPSEASMLPPHISFTSQYPGQAPQPPLPPLPQPLAAPGMPAYYSDQREVPPGQSHPPLPPPDARPRSYDPFRPDFDRTRNSGR